MPMGAPQAHEVLRATARNNTRFGGLRNIRSPAQDLVLRRCQFRRSAFRIVASLIPRLGTPSNRDAKEWPHSFQPRCSHFPLRLIHTESPINFRSRQKV